MIPTMQQTFNAAFNGLKAQGFEKSVHSIRASDVWIARGLWNCAPHGPYGRHCAIQHAASALDTDDVSMWDEARKTYGAETGFFPDLMRAHNDASSPADMERRLRVVAATHSLTIPGDDAKPDKSLFKRFMDKVREPVAVEA